jgi:hypothetical protein
MTLSITQYICDYDKCRYVECRDLCIIMMNVIMLSVLAPNKHSKLLQFVNKALKSIITLAHLRWDKLFKVHPS